MPGRIVHETERLILREFTADDAEVYFRLGADPNITRYTGDQGVATVEQALEVMQARPIADYAKYGYGRWACVFKENGEVIGFAGLKYVDDLAEVDIGYRLLPAYWGRGLATEASLPAIDYGFTQLGLKQIIGLVMPENVASVRVLEKLGLRYDGIMDYRSLQVARYVIERVLVG